VRASLGITDWRLRIADRMVRTFGIRNPVSAIPLGLWSWTALDSFQSTSPQDAEKLYTMCSLPLWLRLCRVGNRPGITSRNSRDRPCCGKVSRPCHGADRRSPAPRGDLRSRRRRGHETRAEPAGLPAGNREVTPGLLLNPSNYRGGVQRGVSGISQPFSSELYNRRVGQTQRPNLRGHGLMRRA